MTLRVVELFAGIGAQAKALERLGIPHECTVCEIDPHAYASYQAVHGPTPNLGDIREVEHLPDCDLLTWSFPCQDLSVSGLQRGMAEGSGTRSSLAWEVLRLVRDAVEREREPEVLVMENVEAVLFEANLSEFDRLRKALADLGYTNSTKVLNAKDFGVPQNRPRCFMVSMRGHRLLRFPAGHPTEMALADVLEPDPGEEYFLPPEKVAVYERHRQRHEAEGHGFGWRPSDGSGAAHALTCDPSRPSQNFVVIAGMLDLPGWHEQICRVYSPAGLSPCSTTQTGGGHRTKIEVGDRIRTLTPREYWRLMGFDDADYDRAAEVSSKSQLYKQAGNSIVVPVLEAIFRAVFIDRSWTIVRPLEAFA